MKLRYRQADGEILCVGSFVDLQAGTGEMVEDFEGVIPARIDYFKRTAPGVISEKSQAEKDAADAKVRPLTKAKLKAYVNAGSTTAEKFDRLLNVVAAIADKVIESQVN